MLTAIAFAAILLLTVGGGAGASGAPHAPRAAPHVAAAKSHRAATLLHAGPSLARKRGAKDYRLPSSFLGVNVLPYASAGSNVTQFLNSTGLRFVRWPGGAIGDGFNYSSNVITRTSGTTYKAPWTTSQFIKWCESFRCEADFQLPGEINDPATAAYYVAYVEQTLGFHPALWEIGNEPALWTEYNVSWSHWGHAATSKITPAGYADLVQRYVAAIHAVDPKAHILGLPGVGTGAYREDLWIADTVAVNGPNLSGVGIHVYPAGRSPVTNGNLSQFYRGLRGGGGIAKRVALDEAAIRQACPSCKHLRIYATEVGSETQGTTGYTSTARAAMEGFPEVPYVAAEVAQGMQEHVAGLDFYSLTSGYPGSIFTSPNGSGRPVADLLGTVLPNVDRYVVPTWVNATPLGVYAVLSRNHASTSFTVFVANANATNGANLSLAGVGLPVAGFGEVWRWTNQSSDPRLLNWSLGSLSSLWIPPESVVLLKIASSASLLTPRHRLAF